MFFFYLSLPTVPKQLLGEDYRGYLLKILNRCTALEPSQRYQSVAELLNALDNQRRLQLFKKIFAVGIVFISVTAIPAATTDIQPIEDEQVAPVTPDEQQIESPALVDEVVATKQPSTFPQILLMPPTSAPIEPLEPIEPATLPEPANPKKNTVKTRESFDGVDMYLYLNGAVTGTNSNFVDINDWQSWTRHDNGVTFPADWNARFHVENHGDADLIDPLITVSIGQEKFSVQKSTVKVGQSLNLDIPLAGKFAAPINGVGIIHIVLQTQGRKPLYLNRMLRLIQIGQ